MKETEYIMSSPMVDILREGDEQIASGQYKPIALENIWK